MSGKLIFVMILLLYFGLFLARNSAPQVVDFVIVKARASKASLMFISAVIGFIIGAVLVHRSQKKAGGGKKDGKVRVR